MRFSLRKFPREYYFYSVGGSAQIDKTWSTLEVMNHILRVECNELRYSIAAIRYEPNPDLLFWQRHRAEMKYFFSNFRHANAARSPQSRCQQSVSADWSLER